MEQVKILLSDLSTEEFTDFIVQIMGMVFGFVFVVIVACYITCYLFKEFVDIVLFIIRGDKYRSKSSAVYMLAVRHMAELRKQVKYSKSEKAYFLFYNQLLGAFHAYTRLGILGHDSFLKFCNDKLERKKDV